MVFALDNLGNTCYLNTSIQCLMSSSILVKSIQESPSDKPLVSLLKTFIAYVLDEDQKNINKTLPKLIVHIQRSIKDRMKLTQQNDMCEFLLLFFDLLNEEMKSVLPIDHFKDMLAKQYPISTDSNTLQKFNQICIKKWATHFHKEYHELNEQTQSLCVSQIKCGCSKTHHNYEFNNMLQLDIDDIGDLDNSMKNYVKSVYFNDSKDENNIEWTCDVCKKQQRSKKVISFWKFPNVLILVLKRFVMNNRGRLTKLTHEVQFPREMDVSKYVLNDSMNTKYKLRSIGCHQGRLNYGHYYTILKGDHDRDHDWIIADDETLERVNELNRNAYKDAYVLVYEISQ